MRAGDDFFAASVKWEDAVGELSKLFPLHWEEVGMGTKMCVGYRQYGALAKSGGLTVVGLYRSGVLVGYWTLLVTPFLHNITERIAQTDLVFIAKPHRSRVAWETLYSKVQEILLAKNVHLWFVGSKTKRNIGKLLERKGFSLEELMYVKRLGHGG